jgi:hypothetical protein
LDFTSYKDFAPDGDGKFDAGANALSPIASVPVPQLATGHDARRQNVRAGEVATEGCKREWQELHVF